MRHLEAAAAWAIVGLSVVLCAPVVGAPQAPAAERLFSRAVAQERDGDLEGALASYRRLADQYPASPRAPRALLRAARMFHTKRDLVEAQLAAQRLVADYSGAPEAAAGLVLLAAMRTRSTVRPAELENEREQLRRVAARFGPAGFPRLEWRAEARVREGDLGLRLGDHARAAAVFAAVIEEEPPGRWVARARLGLGYTLLVEGRWREAAGVLQRLVSGSSEAAGPARDTEAAGVAKRLLTSIHRLYLRPQAGQPSWTRARKVALSGIRLKEATGLAVSAGGRLLVADSAAGTVYLAAPDGSVTERLPVREAGHPSWAPRRPFWSDSDSLPCVAGGGGLRCPGEEAAAGFAPGGAGVSWAGARGPQGQWYLLDAERGSVRVWGAAGEARPALQVTDACDLAVDLRGRVYVLEREADRVSRFDRTGAREDTAAGWKWRRPEAVAVDLLGRVYVLDGRERRVDVFNAEGSRLSEIGPLLPGGIELRRPVDLAIDEQARLYILDSRLEAVVVLE